VWEDADTDVALIAVSATGLTAARLGDSSGVEIGEFVLAVGSPFGLSHSVTYGIISAKGRRDLELGDNVELQDFLQTDAAINPGNSGGPLINLRGEVIGINTAIASNSGGNEGIGFSIPINGVLHIVRQFIEHGRVVRAYLGVTLDQHFNTTVAVKMGLSRRQGAHVTGVKATGPAQTARLKAGDVILRFNGVRVENDTHLIYLVSLTDVGKEVPLEVYRDGVVFNVNVKVGNKSDFEPAR
jgi:serine protease Do